MSQMPAIALYVSRELDLLPDDPFEVAMAMKVLMDCNDVLMEICRYNGSSMWTREEWTLFRSERLPRWLAVFEESLRRDFIGRVLLEKAADAAIEVFRVLADDHEVDVVRTFILKWRFDSGIEFDRSQVDVLVQLKP